MKRTIFVLCIVSLYGVIVYAVPVDNVEHTRKRSITDFVIILPNEVKDIFKPTSQIHEREEKRFVRASSTEEIQTEIKDLEAKGNMVYDKDMFEHVANKENDIKERALIIIQQRYKVPLVNNHQQKYTQKKFFGVNYKSFFSNYDENLLLHTFNFLNKPPNKSHKELFTTNKAKSVVYKMADRHILEFKNHTTRQDDSRLVIKDNKKKTDIFYNNYIQKPINVEDPRLLRDDFVNMKTDRSFSQLKGMNDELITYVDHHKSNQQSYPYVFNNEQRLMHNVSKNFHNAGLKTQRNDYFKHPNDIDFHDRRILSKIEELDTMGSQIQPDDNENRAVGASHTVDQSNDTMFDVVVSSSSKRNKTNNKKECMCPDCLTHKHIKKIVLPLTETKCVCSTKDKLNSKSSQIESSTIEIPIIGN